MEAPHSFDRIRGRVEQWEEEAWHGDNGGSRAYSSTSASLLSITIELSRRLKKTSVDAKE